MLSNLFNFMIIIKIVQGKLSHTKKKLIDTRISICHNHIAILFSTLSVSNRLRMNQSNNGTLHSASRFKFSNGCSMNTQIIVKNISRLIALIDEQLMIGTASPTQTSARTRAYLIVNVRAMITMTSAQQMSSCIQFIVCGH